MCETKLNFKQIEFLLLKLLLLLLLVTLTEEKQEKINTFNFTTLE